jgi:hypothetical protein
MTNDNAHAISNARSWLANITDLQSRQQAALAADDQDAVEAINDEIQGQPLSVQVRDGWRTPGAKGEPLEYEVLLSTGGPALRIYGELGEYDEPHTARLQWQDWFTPWTDLEMTNEEQEAVMAYAGCFYYADA